MMDLKWQAGLALMMSTKRCGAKTRRSSVCKAPAMKNGRCYMHGGKSPGAPKGEQHGRYTQGRHTSEAIARRRYARVLIKILENFNT